MSTNLPEVWIIPKQEIETVNTTINGLKDYQSRNWAIGLNGDTLQPDGFLKFFEDRQLAFQFYVRSHGVSIGEPSAYENNIATLGHYSADVYNAESKRIESTISELKNYQSKNWAIGLNGDTLQPDGFVKFFGERNLMFDYYVRSQGVTLGDPSAYEKNIETLENYMKSIPKV